MKVFAEVDNHSFFKSADHSFNLFHGDAMTIIPQLKREFDMVFADPPYFLSNDGHSIHNGQIVSVNKDQWDKLTDFDSVYAFNRQWIGLVREKMKANATLWISGTIHNIFSIGQALTELDFKILNIIVWKKSNPPPNLSCRVFTHSTELIIWARKEKKTAHCFNYEVMKQLNGNRQMKDVWELSSVAKWEKSCGKHPTQKPLALLKRIVLSSTKPNDWILDPFAGSCTTGIAANLFDRNFIGIDQERSYLQIGKKRRLEIEYPKAICNYTQRL
jgi:site-specific DNA-methyltransferase (adenine-specific)